MSKQGQWTYRPEYHLGDPAFSLFDPADERAAVGLTLQDAQAICTAMNAPTPSDSAERAHTGTDASRPGMNPKAGRI